VESLKERMQGGGRKERGGGKKRGGKVYRFGDLRPAFLHLPRPSFLGNHYQTLVIHQSVALVIIDLFVIGCGVGRGTGKSFNGVDVGRGREAKFCNTW